MALETSKFKLGFVSPPTWIYHIILPSNGRTCIAGCITHFCLIVLVNHSVLNVLTLENNNKSTTLIQKSYTLNTDIRVHFCNCHPVPYLLTLSPFSTKALAIAAPIPELTPVTTATFPSQRSIFVFT
jgi:hypothetical protein